MSRKYRSPKNTGQSCAAWLVAMLVAAGFSAAAQSNVIVSNVVSGPASSPVVSTSRPPAHVESATPPSTAPAGASRSDEAAFRIISERNIFNANRSGGRVQLASRRAPRIETFTLVGTMAYEKGAFAFFDGSSSEFTKVLKANGVIAGHKIVDVLADGVKLEADGKVTELPIGSQMRREDAGAWLMSEASGESGSAYVSTRTSDSGRSSRSSRSTDSRTRTSTATPTPSVAPATPAVVTPPANQDEILKRLKERREKE